MQQILNEQAVPPSQKDGQVHPAFDEAVRLALEKAPAHRFATADQFLAALKQAHFQSGCQPETNDGTRVLHDDDRTVLAGEIVRIQAGAAGSQTGSDRHRGPMPGGECNEPGETTAPWKLSTFPGLEAVLSAQIGPIAKVLLKRAGARAENFDELGTLLVPHIPSESGRSAFQAALGKCKAAQSMDSLQSGLPMSTDPVPTRDNLPSSLTGAGVADGSVSSELIAHAETLLPQYIGAIAKIVIKRSVPKARNRADFLVMISNAIESETEREKFLKTIKSFIEH
jgi:serine/threonine-protein kinase